jgi:alpha-D-xyloside xylohydrolase
MIPHPLKAPPLRTGALSARGNRLELETEAGTLSASCYAPGIFRLQLGGSQGPDYQILSGAEVVAPCQVEVAGIRGALRSGGLSLELCAEPFGLRLLRGERTLLESSTDQHISGRLRVPRLISEGQLSGLALALGSGEAVYGLGERFGPLNHRGELVECWDSDALGVNSGLAYLNAPFAWSPSGWGVFAHTPARSWHGVGYPSWSHRSYLLLCEEPGFDLFLLAGDPCRLLERYSYLTGRPGRLPSWSYGVWWSRCYYRDAAEVLEVAEELRRRAIPADVITLDGRAWLEVRTRCTLDFDRSRYPDPAGFAAQLRELGFRLCVWEYPYVSTENPEYPELEQLGYFLKDGSGATYIYRWDQEPFGALLTPLPDSGLIDFTNPAAAAWWQQRHQRLWDLGVDVIKTDFGEQIPEDCRASNGDRGSRLHNAYPLLYNRAVHQVSPQGLVFARSGYSGSQRYPLQWGGDPQSDWEGLAASVRGGLCWGMSGGAHQTHDVGGFYGPPPDPELYVRWTQAAALASQIRFHGTSPREPWFFGEEAEQIVRRWLRLRIRLLPQLQLLGEEASKNGLPLLRAMPLAFPGDRLAASFEQQFLLGDSLLVAPVTRPGGRVSLFLPAGGWFDLWSGQRLQGPLQLQQQVPLERIPLYGREGGRLLLGQPGDRSPAGSAEQVVWRFGGQPAAGELLWDGQSSWPLLEE